MNHLKIGIKKCLLVVALCIAVVVLVWFVRLTAARILSRTISCPRCNIVILDIDTLRADELRCAGAGIKITPNLCRLIRQGTNFTNAFSQSFWTLPSSLSTYTSLYPNVNNVWDLQKHESIASSTGTLATSLRQYGYDSSYSGYPDLDPFLNQRNGGLRGYTHIYFHPTSTNDWLDAYKAAVLAHQSVLFHFYSPWLHMPYLLNSDQAPIVDLPKPKGFPVNWEEYNIVFRDYLLSHVNDIFLPETIAQHPEIFESDSAIRGKQIVDYFNLLESQNDYTKRKSSWNPVRDSYMQFIDTNNPADIAYLRMMYESTIRALDSHLSGFVDYLLQPNVANHTIVVITSAHGEAFGEHGTFEHVSIPYNEAYHVPLIIKYPHSSGKQAGAVVENIDIFPTLMQMVTGKVSSDLRGISLVPLLSGISMQAKLFAISMNYTSFHYNNVFVIQNRRYALVLYRDNSYAPELYDLRKDPQELHDIAYHNPNIVKRYMYLLKQTQVTPEYFSPISQPLVPPVINKKDLIRSGYF